jgi:hypothetical protein
MTAPTRRPTTGARALVVVFLAFLVCAAPGVASAAPASSVTPFLDCVRENRDGSYTVVLGYSNNGSRTSIPHGSRNFVYPYEFQGDQPTQFLTGTQRGVFAVTVSGYAVLAFRWEVDDRTVNFWSFLSARECSPSTPLPVLGNGAGIAVVLVVGGLVGIYVVRRVVRRAAGTA